MTTRHSSVLRRAILSASLFLYNNAASGCGDPSETAPDLSQLIVEFQVDVMGVLPVTGKFHDVQGSVVQTQPGGDSAVSISVALDSVDTRNAERDRLLRSSAFFDVARFPSIQFTASTLLTGQDGEQRLSGEMILRGVKKPISFALGKLEDSAPHNAGLSRAYAAHATIKRTDFGLNGFRMLVDDEVEITVYIAEELIELLTT